MQSQISLLMESAPDGVDKQILVDLQNVLNKKVCFWCSQKGHWLSDCGNYKIMKRHCREDTILRKAFEHLDEVVLARVKIGEIYIEGVGREGMEAYVSALLKGEEAVAPTPENVVGHVEKQLLKTQKWVRDAVGSLKVVEGGINFDDFNAEVDKILGDIE